jgi:uncharacterized LabA/DUF88 family protein
MITSVHYLFIDGGYLRKRYADGMQRVFGVDGDLNIRSIRNWLTSKVNRDMRRVFYYDCLHDIKLSNENDDEFAARLKKQRAEFDEIQSIPGFHVHLGTLKGTTKRPRQKGVDVLLAVELLDHASRKNMDEAWLLAGDGDFVPLVEAVVRIGTWVNVVFDPRAVAKELYSAADRGLAIHFDDIYAWSSDSAQQAFKKPEIINFAGPQPGIIDSGTHQEGQNENGQKLEFGQQANGKGLLIAYTINGSTMALKHTDEKVIKNYACELFGQISWK